MKWTVIAMMAVVLGLAALAASKGLLVAGLRAAGTQSISFLPVLVIAFVIMGFMEVLLPRDVVQTWLSDASGWRGLLIAWLAGVLTPAGSIIGMPMAAGLWRAGVGASVLITYLTSLATLSLLRVPMEVGFYGWSLTGLRVAASLILPLIAGLLTRLVTSLFMSAS